MAKVKVYKVEAVAPNSWEVTLSKRMATREGAAIMHGRVIEGTEIEIDESQLEPGEQWTPIDCTP